MTDFDGVLPDDWKEILPEDMRGNGVLDTVKNIENLAKMAIDGRALASNALRIPSEDASEADQKAFKDDLMTKLPDLMFKPDVDNPESVNEIMRTLGAPTEVAGYDMPDIPEPIKESMAHLSEKALGAGLTKKQFGAITDGILEDFKTNSDEAYGAMDNDRNSLKTDWGVAYETKVKTISHFAKQTGFSDDFVAAINNGQVDSTNMKAFDHVVKGFEGEANQIGHQTNNPDAIMTPQEADSRLNELMGNKDHAYWHPENPEHKAAIDKVMQLGKLVELGEKSPDDKFRQLLTG